MSWDEMARLPGGREGCRIRAIGRFEAGAQGPAARVWSEVSALQRRRMQHSGRGLAVSTVHLRHPWDYPSPKADWRFRADWRRRAMPSGAAHLRRVARRLRPDVAGLVAHDPGRLHPSLRKGVTNTIKRIIRMAYGFRDDDCCFLKIRAALPGIARCTEIIGLLPSRTAPGWPASPGPGPG